MSSPVVSVLMTAYNREKYIGDAINSVLASTFTDFELIIVDDNSTDGTVEIARRYELADPRVKLYVNEKNLGDYPNRNVAAGYAKGRYIKYLDSDDLIYPHGLAVFVSSIDQFPDSGLCVSHNSGQMEDPFPVFVDRKDVLRHHFFTSGILNIGPSGTIIRKEAFDRVGGFSGKRMVGDTELWYALSCRYDVVVSPPSLIFWRRHDGQEFFDGLNSGLYDELTLGVIRELFGSQHCTLSSEERTRLLRRYKFMTSRKLLKSLVKTGDLGRFRSVSKKLGLRGSDYLDALINRRA
jgi:glycosyltransferase involved in cell wall biosynthesis